MAVDFFEGFENGSIPDWTLLGASVFSTVGLNMDGNYCLKFDNSNYRADKAVTPFSEKFFSLMWRCVTISYQTDIISFYSDSTLMLKLITSGSPINKVQLYRGATLIATGSKVITSGQTYLIEGYLKIHDTSGEFILKIDGLSDIIFNGDTKPSIETEINLLRFIQSGVSSADFYIDNIIMGSSWIGEKFIQAIIPTGTGTTDDFTPSAGDNYQCVDEIPASDDDYSETNTPDAVCTFVTSDLVGEIGTVCAIKVEARAKIEGDTAVPKLQLVLRSNGTDYVSDSKDVPYVTPTSVSEIWTEDPAGGNLTVTKVNNFEIGIKAKAS